VRREATAVIGLFLVLGGCTSPETRRTRGGGPGADVGNRGEIVEMHEGSKPFYETPKIIPTEHPSLAPADQAAGASHR
jgi:hypothetical protein